MRLPLWPLLCLLSLPAQADTDIFNLTGPERTAFGAQVRALLLDEPELVQPVFAPPYAGAYDDNVRADTTLLQDLETELLGGAEIAIFVGENCADCAAAVAELEDISMASGTTFTHHDTRDADAAKLAELLEVDELPFYVMRDRILRGHMPAVVLTRYLTQP